MLVNLAHCHRCGGVIENPNNSFCLYLQPGARDAGKAPVEVHAECIADDVKAGKLVRVSPFAFEPVSKDE